MKVLLDEPLGWRMYLLLWSRVYLHKTELNLLVDNLAGIHIIYLSKIVVTLFTQLFQFNHEEEVHILVGINHW